MPKITSFLTRKEVRVATAAAAAGAADDVDAICSDLRRQSPWPCPGMKASSTWLWLVGTQHCCRCCCCCCCPWHRSLYYRRVLIVVVVGHKQHHIGDWWHMDTRLEPRLAKALQSINLANSCSCSCCGCCCCCCCCRRRATFAFFSFNLLQVAGSMQHATKLSKFHFGLLLAHLSGNENISPGGGGRKEKGAPQGLRLLGLCWPPARLCLIRQ